MSRECVKTLRNQKGWSQTELAALSGLSVKTIQRLEHGQGAPSLETAKALASIFDRPFSDFLPAAPPTGKSVQLHSDSAEPIEITSTQESADVYANMLHKAKHYWRPALTTVCVAALFGFLNKLYVDMATLSRVVTDMAVVMESNSAYGLSGEFDPVDTGDALICSTEGRCENGTFDHYYGDQALMNGFQGFEESIDSTHDVTLLEFRMLRDTAKIVTVWEGAAKQNSDMSSSMVLSNYLRCYSNLRLIIFSASEDIQNMQDCVYTVLTDAQWEVSSGMNQALKNLAQKMKLSGPYRKNFRLPVAAGITIH